MSDLFVPRPFEFTTKRPVPVITAITHDGKVEVSFNATMALKSMSGRRNRRQLRDSFENQVIEQSTNDIVVIGEQLSLSDYAEISDFGAETEEIVKAVTVGVIIGDLDGENRNLGF